MAEARKIKKIKKVKKVIEKIPEPIIVIEKDYVIIDYSSFLNENFIQLINEIWTNSHTYDTHGTQTEIISRYLIKLKFYHIISELRYHISVWKNTRTSLAEKYGDFDPNTNNWIIDPTKQEEFTKDLNNLNDKRIQAETEKINLIELYEIQYLVRSPLSNISLENIEFASDFINFDMLLDDEITNNQ
jgi:hypothetical protein